MQTLLLWPAIVGNELTVDSGDNQNDYDNVDDDNHPQRHDQAKNNRRRKGAGKKRKKPSSSQDDKLPLDGIDCKRLSPDKDKSLQYELPVFRMDQDVGQMFLIGNHYVNRMSGSRQLAGKKYYLLRPFAQTPLILDKDWKKRTQDSAQYARFRDRYRLDQLHNGSTVLIALQDVLDKKKLV